MSQSVTSHPAGYNGTHETIARVLVPPNVRAFEDEDALFRGTDLELLHDLLLRLLRSATEILQRWTH